MSSYTFQAPRQVGRARTTPLRGWWSVVLAFLLALSGCGGDGVQAPAGLGYSMASAVYATGQAIEANRPSASGGKIDRYAVSPALPAGLSIDATTGVIAGTPTAVTAARAYVITASNAGGSATARVQIEVRETAVAPAGLTYRESAVTYTVGETIASNTPASTGGPITAYVVDVALPAGLSLDAGTGVIEGTPTTVTVDAAYTITGSNAAGSTTTTLRIGVQAAPVVPTSFAYASPNAVYVISEAIAANVPTVSGGSVAAFSVSPALPSGLSLNAATGTISGTPLAMQPQAAYTVTASNRAGSVQAPLAITVTSRGSWTSAPDKLVPGHYQAATILDDGKVLVAGGWSGSSSVTAAELYDPVANTWTLTGSMNVARSEFTATKLTDGRVLVAGGFPAMSAPTASAEIYDPATGTWSMTADMATVRGNHTATLLPDGRVLVTGGIRDSASLFYADSAEIFDPVAGTWTQMATPLATARGQHAAVLLPGGTAVLLIGGVNQLGPTHSVERLPLDDSGATTVEPFPTGGNIADAVLLASGSILVKIDTSATTWLYDPATTAWTSVAMSTMRSKATMTLLDDGRVLVANGANGPGMLASAEIFNPGANVWTAATSLSVARSAAQAVVLNDGSVLVTGGSNATSGLASTERYRP